MSPKMKMALTMITNGHLQVDDQGFIWRRKKNFAPIRPERAEEENRDGYLEVRFSKFGRRHRVLAHRLVYTAKHGPIEEDLVVNHIDGNRKNNAPNNLEAITALENERHAREVLGKVTVPPVLRGEAHGRSKLTWDIVKAMRAEHAAGATAKDVSIKYGISSSQASKILRGVSWKETPGE